MPHRIADLTEKGEIELKKTYLSADPALRSAEAHPEVPDGMRLCFLPNSWK